MQKPTKKLRLNSQAVRNLTADQLKSADGGVTTDSGNYCSFIYSCVQACSAGQPITTCGFQGGGG